MAKDLTALAIANLLKAPPRSRREVADGKVRGLFLVLQPTGKASWALRYRFDRTSRKLTLGPYPDMDLRAAREAAGAALSKLAQDINPAVLKQATKAAARLPAERELVIRATLSDNPDLARTNYASVLASLPEELRRAYRDGDFSVGIRDADFQVIPTAWVLAAEARWKPDGAHGLAMTAMALDPAGGGRDSAELAGRYGGWYAELICAKGKRRRTAPQRRRPLSAIGAKNPAGLTTLAVGMAVAWCFD